MSRRVMSSVPRSLCSRWDEAQARTFEGMKSKLFNKVLVANRGEIAIRVMRACRELGIATAAVYSDADRNAIHVRYADEAHHIGGAAPSDSYLQLDRIVKVAHDCGADRKSTRLNSSHGSI